MAIPFNFRLCFYKINLILYIFLYSPRSLALHLQLLRAIPNTSRSARLGIGVGDLLRPDPGHRVCGWQVEDHRRDVQPVSTANLLYDHIGPGLFDPGLSTPAALHWNSGDFSVFPLVSL